MMRQLLTPALLVLLAACSAGAGEFEPLTVGAGTGRTADSRRDLAELAAFRAVGEPRSCIQISRIRQSRVLSDKVIDFELRGGGRLRNTLPISCPRLGFEERFTYRTTIGQLCSGDIITVLQEPGLSAGPSCGLGQFQQVERVGA